MTLQYTQFWNNKKYPAVVIHDFEGKQKTFCNETYYNRNMEVTFDKYGFISPKYDGWKMLLKANEKILDFDHACWTSNVLLNEED